MEDDQFPQEDIETIAKNAIVGTLGDCAYNAKKVGARISFLGRLSRSSEF